MSEASKEVPARKRKMVGLIEVELAGTRYRFTAEPWPHAVGKKWIPRLTEILLRGAVLGGIGGKMNPLAFVQAMVSDPETFLEFVNTCEEHTVAVRIPTTGDATRVNFKVDVDPLLAGNAGLGLSLKLVRAHVETQWEPFFSTAIDELEDLFEAETETKKDGS